MISRIIAGATTVGLGVWFNYLIMPAWNVWSAGMWGFLILMVFIAAIAFGIAEYISIEYGDGEFFTCTICSAGVMALLILCITIGALTSAEMFNASLYHNIIDIEECENFEQDIPSVSSGSVIPIVDVSTARRVGDRTVGGIKNASWYEVAEEYNMIKYQGKYYRISELNYGGLFKFNKAKDFGIPGYVLVDAQTQEATYVELEDAIKYSPSGHYDKLLKRHLRKEFPGYMFGKSFFEIDEEGTPCYITAVETPTIGQFGGKVQKTFVITNAITGENKVYTKEDVPEWVDHVYSVDYLMTQVHYHQNYIDGFWNSVFSQTGINRTSYDYAYSSFEGYNTVITATGEIAFYTGVTPASNAESNLGFILASPRTGEIKYYSCSGAEEASAQVAAEGLVQNLRYEATFPTILNVDGEETYFMLLKDSAGLVQRYALCNVRNYTKVVQAETFEEALKLYREKLGTVEVTIESEESSTEGVISTLYQAQIDGYTYFYFTLEGSNNLYMSSIENSHKQVMLEIGTKVKINYITSLEDGVYIVKKIEF